MKRPADKEVEEWIEDEHQTGWSDIVRELRRARASEASLLRMLQLYQGKRRLPAKKVKK